VVNFPDAVGARGDLCVSLPYALLLAAAMKLPVIIDRGEAKGYGSERRYESAFDYAEGMTVVWIDDRNPPLIPILL
jgi:orotate phosphoribosyltransferase